VLNATGYEEGLSDEQFWAKQLLEQSENPFRVRFFNISAATGIRIESAVVLAWIYIYFPTTQFYSYTYQGVERKQGKEVKKKIRPSGRNRSRKMKV
jgi:hypothetical protein